MDLGEISDHLEIQQVMYRYCRGIDRGDRELIKSAYHFDAHDAHGGFDGLAHEFADDIVARMDAVDLIGQHMVANMLIELDGDVARVETYFQALQPAVGPDGKAGHALVCGRYLDRFERRDGSWKIADRKVIFDLSREPELPPPWVSAGNYPAGARRGDDLSANFFARG